MSPKFIFILFILLFPPIYGQEICNNGLDDDGDFLIDNLDTVDCICNQTELDSIPNFLPNPSFEEYTQLPTGFNCMSFCVDWFQATTATSDYQNHYGWNMGPPIDQPPYGNGFVGFYVYEDWLEYVGACLTSPLIAGSSYTYKCKIAAFPILYGDLVPAATVNMGNTSIKITIYGHPTCYTFPISTVQSPPEGDPTWKVLGFVTYVPQPFWSDLQITFTPSFNVNSIIIGPPKYSSLPANFEGSFTAQAAGPTSPYFFMDFAVLGKSNSFNNYNMDVTTHCFDLIATSTNGSSNYFWNNGTMNDTLRINDPGDYIVTAIDTNGCKDVDTVHVPPLFDVDLVYSCSINPAHLSLQTNSSIVSYHWYFPTGSSFTELYPNPIVTFNLPDTNYFSLILENKDGCIDTLFGAINIIQPGELIIPNVLAQSSTVGNDRFDFNLIVPGLNECMDHDLYIYNRWGTEVFTTHNRKFDPDINCTSCFKGFSSAGQKLSAGTYYYVFKLEESSYKGFIEIFE